MGYESYHSFDNLNLFLQDYGQDQYVNLSEKSNWGDSEPHPKKLSELIWIHT